MAMVTDRAEAMESRPVQCFGKGHGPRLHRKSYLRVPLRGLIILVGASVGLGSFFAAALAQQPSPSEYQVKAAFLYNFGKFVEWPNPVAPAGTSASLHSGQVFSICVLGKDPFGSVLDETIRGKMVHGKNVVARRIPRANDAVNCDILFISSSENDDPADIASSLPRAGVLTVGETPQFVRRGGMITFVTEESKVRFEINLTAAERAGLTVSSQLLKVARNVRGAPQS